MDAGSDADAAPAPLGPPCPDAPMVSSIQPTGSSETVSIDVTCAPNEQCVLTNDVPTCISDPNACIPGTMRCADGNALERCTAAAAWTPETCDGTCKSSALGAYCADTVATGRLEARVDFEVTLPLPDLADWAPTPTRFSGRGLVVASRRGGALIDVAVTAEDGTFALDVPETLEAGDDVAIFAMHAPTGAAEVVVARPEVRTGLVAIDAVVDGAIWTWTVDATDALSTGSILVGEDAGASAAYAFDLARQAALDAEADFGAPADPLLIWLQPDTEWSCTACFLPAPARLDEHRFDAQIFLPAAAGNRSDRLAAPIWHELGHWMMASFGELPDEGGAALRLDADVPRAGLERGLGDRVFSDQARGSPLRRRACRRVSLVRSRGANVLVRRRLAAARSERRPHAAHRRKRSRRDALAPRRTSRGGPGAAPPHSCVACFVFSGVRSSSLGNGWL